MNLGQFSYDDQACEGLPLPELITCLQPLTYSTLVEVDKNLLDVSVPFDTTNKLINSISFSLTPRNALIPIHAFAANVGYEDYGFLSEIIGKLQISMYSVAVVQLYRASTLTSDLRQTLLSASTSHECGGVALTSSKSTCESDASIVFAGHKTHTFFMPDTNNVAAGESDRIQVSYSTFVDVSARAGIVIDPQEIPTDRIVSLFWRSVGRADAKLNINYSPVTPRGGGGGGGSVATVPLPPTLAGFGAILLALGALKSRQKSKPA